MNRLPNVCMMFVIAILSLPLFAQTDPGTQSTPSQDSVASLRQQLQQTQEQLSRSELEIRELRAMMEKMQRQVEALAGPSGKEGINIYPTETETTAQAPASAPASDDWQMLSAKVEEHQQVKVESASKFKLKLSGLVLFNAFNTAGSVDNIDVPEFAVPRSVAAPHGSSGASIRQSIIGFTAIGPQLGGAHTSADLQMDFFGGMPSGYPQYASGIARLRIARMRFDWDKTSITAGLDVPFFSPLSPTSYMSVGEPAFSASGNLWTWVPTVRIEQRQKIGAAQLKIEAGLIDYATYSGYRVISDRIPSPGESSQQPAYSLRLSVNKPSEDNPLAFGIGGIYVPQQYPGGRQVSGWGGTSDFRFPVTSHVEVSGEFFTGKGINGFGGTTFGSIPQDFHYTYVTAPVLASLFSIGGWSQLKLKLNTRNEINAAAGYGGFSSSHLRTASLNDSYLTNVPARNQTMFTNYIFRPRSNLLFSLEYRHLRTFTLSGPPATADQVGAAAGFLF